MFTFLLVFTPSRDFHTTAFIGQSESSIFSNIKGHCTCRAVTANCH
ncbi:Phosphoserine aminotransferase [Frankliniella fusca]|uniref:Phosphoserine aminotransferase n=1 Tax=Frankliniella fusca TaxID=407009 RepID=A0AAE1H7Y0_9NEOP|nr:Phosphoserine aminotransferase [Frankliniella fusca]